ncbi:hypothetical protein FJB21_07215 [Campylobacter coli]|nr:hypothetical protein [Campylobacter coli]EBF6121240.1 hypothetical protein [Campylobacter coli]
MKKFKKGLKLLYNLFQHTHYFTIKKFKKGLKLLLLLFVLRQNFTIKKFKKGLKLIAYKCGVNAILP